MPADRDRPLVLASASPRRRELLKLLGLPFRVVEAAVDEAVRPGEAGDDVAVRLASAKALAGAATRPAAVVLGADTVVVLDGRILGKPADECEARAMLRALRGRPHVVITGVAVASGDRIGWRGLTESVVEMRSYADEELERYVATGRPLDKAGAYAIQDPDFRPARRLVGCYPNVVGLPLCAALRGLRSAGLAPSGPPDDALDPPCALCKRARELGAPF